MLLMPSFSFLFLQEQYLKEWLISNPIMYDRSRGDYLETSKKNEMWRDILFTMNRTSISNKNKDNDVYNWYLSIRTVLGKLLHPPSGSGPLTMTDRRRWIWTFDFLKPHIKKAEKRSCVSVSIFFVTFF